MQSTKPPIYLHFLRGLGLKSLLYRAGTFPDYGFVLVTETKYMNYNAQICNASGEVNSQKHPAFPLEPNRIKLIAFELTPAVTVLQSDFNRFLRVEGKPITVSQRRG